MIFAVLVGLISFGHTCFTKQLIRGTYSPHSQADIRHAAASRAPASRGQIDPCARHDVLQPDVLLPNPEGHA